jgi:hypothetical protein
VSAFQLLTGWPQENLLDPPSGVNLAGGWEGGGQLVMAAGARIQTGRCRVQEVSLHAAHVPMAAGAPVGGAWMHAYVQQLNNTSAPPRCHHTLPFPHLLCAHPGGFLFDRLEDSVRGNEGRVERSAIATVVLRQRALPEKPPPRIVVITGEWV